MPEVSRTVLTAPAAPAAIGPYSQAICAGGFLFASGQIPLDPGTGQLVPGGIVEQTRQVFANLQAILEAGGVSWGSVVKMTVYLIDMQDFTAMNDVYASFVEAPAPARATVQVSRLPRDARVEIDLVAVLP